MQRRYRAHRARTVSMEPMEGRVLLSTYTVTNTNDSGGGSLRQAILDANKASSADTIKFAIDSGARTISPKSKLPGINYPVLIDGTTQKGFAGKPLIELSGASAGSSVDGLKLISSGVTVKGLIINRFSGSGIFIYSNGGDKVVGCYIGTDRTGASAAGNKAHGIIVQAANNTIGGTSSADRNVISGNGNAGVFFFTSAAHHNSVVGNYVGTDATGAKAIGNAKAGVQVNGGTYNTVGGTVAGSRNVISGNKRDGVLFVGSGSQHNTIAGNYIGTTASGSARLGNGWYGVEISQPNNIVGGSTAAARNVISASGYAGVVLYLTSAIGNKVQSNYIGTDYTGTKDLGNTGAGVDITNGAHGNIVGGSSASMCNVISGNDLFGVGIYNGATGNTVQNNRIGICAKGYALLNARSAVSVSSASSNTIKNNTMACVSGYNAVQLNAGGNTSTSNTLYSKVSEGLRVI